MDRQQIVKIGPYGPYPLGDRLTLHEKQELGAESLHLPNVTRQLPPVNGAAIAMAERTGEYRPPKAGEWFVSGAEAAAYRALTDFSTPYCIVRLVRVHRESRLVIERRET